LKIELRTASGLGEGSRVRLNGIDVGYVESITLAENIRQGVVIQTRIAESRRIPADATASVATGLFGGGAWISINAASEEPATEPGQTEYLPTDGSATLVAETATFAERLEQELTRRFETFDQLSEQISRFAETFTQVGNNINQLIEPVDPAAAADHPENIRLLIIRANDNLASLQKAVDSINRIVGDDQLVEDVRQTVANARQLTENGTNLTRDIKQQVDQLTGRFVRVADQLSVTLDQMNSLIDAARRGKGTTGKLINDPALYDNMNDAAKRLGDALDEIKLLIEKWKAEGVPVQF
jgi:phospholipid/cholesterol/gamma-HCH transport system substrate-binding protein